MKLTFTIQQLQDWQKRFNRPADYIDRLRQCAIEQTDTSLSVETDDDCWLSLVQLYRGRAAVTPDEPTPAPRPAARSLTTKRSCGGCSRAKRSDGRR